MASADTTARIWDAASPDQIAVLRGHEKPLNSAAFSRDPTRHPPARLKKSGRDTARDPSA
jgi:WD40 repeat protein